MQIIKSQNLRKNFPNLKILEKSKIKNIEEAADWYTIFVSSIRVSDDKVLFVGPPLLNFNKHIEFYDGNNKLQHKLYNSAKYSTVYVTTKSDTIDLHFNGEKSHVEILNRSEKFKNQIMISTMISDEPMCWVSQWIQYNFKVHDIKSFVIFNNQSKTYTNDELKNYLIENHPYINLEVEDMCIPYGIRSKEFSHNYTQQVGLEYCKQMYAWCAKAFVNIDVDELLAFRKGININDIVIQMEKTKGHTCLDPVGVSHYDSITKINSLDLPTDEVHIKNYYNRAIGPAGGAKYMCIPKFHMKNRWKTHDIIGSKISHRAIIFHTRCHTSRSCQDPEFIKKKLGSRKDTDKTLDILKSNLEKAFPPEDK